MIEILNNLDVLKNTDLELSELSMSGVIYGSSVNDMPLDLVTEVTLAPIVKGQSSSTDSGSKYFDENRNEISQEKVIQNVVEEGGCLHFKGNISFFIKNGRVSEFSLYGPQKEHFSYIKDLEHLIREFGKPDILKSKDAYGDLFDSKLYYRKSKRYINWNHMGDEIVCILLGREECV